MSFYSIVLKSSLFYFTEEKQKESEEQQEENAATKIQAVFRGHQTRKSMSMKTSKQPAEQEKEKEPTRAELEAEFRADDKGKGCLTFLEVFSGYYFNLNSTQQGNIHIKQQLSSFFKSYRLKIFLDESFKTSNIHNI